MCVLELPVSTSYSVEHAGRVQKTEGKEGQTKEPLVDRMQIGSFHLSRSVTHLCAEHLCANFVRMGFNQARVCKKYEALMLLQKLVNQKRATVLGRPIYLT